MVDVLTLQRMEHKTIIHLRSCIIILLLEYYYYTKYHETEMRIAFSFNIFTVEVKPFSYFISLIKIDAIAHSLILKIRER